MSELVLRPAVAPADLQAAYDIRRTVFVDEQGVPLELERDERDAEADHVLAVLDAVPVGAVRLVIEPAGFHGLDQAYGPIAHLGRLAVLTSARGLGIGAALVRAVEELARQQHRQAVYLGGQTQALGFYERLGYRAFGDEFDDAGLPHRHLARVL